MDSAAPVSPERIAYTVAEAAQAVGIGKTTMWGLIRDGVVVAVKLGGRTLIRKADLEAALQLN